MDKRTGKQQAKLWRDGYEGDSKRHVKDEKSREYLRAREMKHASAYMEADNGR